MTRQYRVQSVGVNGGLMYRIEVGLTNRVWVEWSIIRLLLQDCKVSKVCNLAKLFGQGKQTVGGMKRRVGCW